MYRFDTLAFYRGPHKVPRLCGEKEEKEALLLAARLPSTKRLSRSSRGEVIASLRGASEFSPLGGNNDTELTTTCRVWGRHSPTRFRADKF